jgi:dolichol-phosphate mannosyltransferase
MIYILLPAYNEEDSIDNLFPKLKNFFENTLKQDYHIIICNDGSRDKTAEKVASWEGKIPLTVLTHSINRGLGETIRDLFEYVSKVTKWDDIVIRIDCDDTHDPAFMGGLINRLNDGCDIVIASRFVPGGGQEGLDAYRTYISYLANRFMRIFFPIKGLKEYSSGFRAYKAEIIKKAIFVYGNDFIQLKGLGFTCTLEKIVKMKMLGAKFGEAPFVLRYDLKVSPSKMIGSVTTFGYFTLALLYHWPFGGWRGAYKKAMPTLLKNFEEFKKRELSK